jgi:3-deoxy-manno-octulosonate cytidylyltransferase (CMP-KDO synthetase)
MTTKSGSGTAIAVIPARYASSRFPGKPLAKILGKPMVQHVHERCVESGAFSRVIVATDDARILEVVSEFGGEGIFTSSQCRSGTDRVAEAARGLKLNADAVVVNVQGDEPALHPSALLQLVKAFDEPSVQMATLVRRLATGEGANPNVVKAVLDERSNALYFSRADVPYPRTSDSPLLRWAHVGIYGYRMGTLERLTRLPVTLLEEAESLEQLRALGNGIAIRCCVTARGSTAVDTPDDVPAAEAALRTIAHLE